ncbi:MAG: ABC transporter permease [Betaproteobacteria bacterium]|nr:ABC transporter permease [Betaproteobacteria bacterium]
MQAKGSDAAGESTGAGAPVAGDPAPAPWGLWRAAGRLLVTFLPIGGLFLVWEFVVYVGWFKPTLLSPPSQAFREVWTYFSSGAILPHLGASLRRGALGFSIAALVGVPLGLFIGSVRLVSLAASPVIEFLRQLPPLAMLPVFLLFLGLGFRAQVAIVIWAAIWPILLNTITGARGVDERLKKAARTLGAGRRDIFLKVALPSALPTIMTGVRLGASYAFLVLVAAEMVGADSGLGFLILNNQYTFKIPQMYAAILILALLGVILNYGLIALERHLTPWRGHA